MKFKSKEQLKKERKERESWEREEARLKEEARLASLSVWEKIEECDASSSVKEMLHMFAEKLGMEP